MSIQDPAAASDSIPSSARVVVIGGGVVGCSVAYHLARCGWRDVVLLEREKLTSGTTWHAAGLVVTSGFTTETSVELARYTRDLYAGLEEETGFATGFTPVGLLQVAANEEILIDLRRKASFNRLMGVESQELSPAEIRDLWPLARTEDLLAGFYTEGDGRANPVDLTMSLARGAAAGGVRIVEGICVTGILREAQRVRACGRARSA
jgi:4-methylaminobutanoate oxidase (formaldehyde-forming)